MKFKSQIRKFKDYLNNLKNSVYSKTFTRDVLDDLAVEAIKLIVNRTRVGKGVNNVNDPNAKESPLPPLSESYKAMRKGKMYFFRKNGKIIPVLGKSYKLSKVGPYFKPTKPNMTFTGKMLESIDYRISKDKGFTLFIKGDRAKIAEYLAEPRTVKTNTGHNAVPARQWFALTEKERNVLVAKLRQIIRKMAKQF